MKTYGSAVLTALQAQYLSIEEIVKLIYLRRFDSYMKGDDNDNWVDCFWCQMSLIQAHGRRVNKYKTT